MSLPKSRLFATAFGVLLLGAWVGPGGGADSLPRLARYRAVRDTTFAVPDSVRALFTFIISLVVEPDSSLYVADPSLGAVLNLTPTGELRRVVGRRGGGPGEFSRVLALGTHRDSLWVLDPGLVRLTLLPLRGQGAVTIPMANSAPALPGNPPQARRGMASSVLLDGSLLVEETFRQEETGMADATPAVRYIYRTDRDLRILDTLARHDMNHTVMVFRWGDGASDMAQPFTDAPLYRMSSDGSQVVMVDRRVSSSGQSGTFSVTIWRLNQPLIRREVPFEPQPLTDAAVDSTLHLFFQPGETRSRGSPVTIDSIRRHLYRPATYPPVQEVWVANDGATWLKLHVADSPKGMADWLVLSRRGFEMYRVSLPTGFRMLEAASRTVWGTDSDPYDVPLLVRYTIPEQPS